MANARSKALRSKAKDVRQAPRADGKCNGKKRKKARLEFDVIFVGQGIMRNRTLYSSATKEQAEEWVAKQSRSYGQYSETEWEIRKRPNT